VVERSDINLTAVATTGLKNAGCGVRRDLGKAGLGHKIPFYKEMNDSGE
jgi:hypothetical protein